MKALIEMPVGSRYKWEIDPETKRLKLDRPLTIACPANYGYIENTKAPDGDALDIFVLTREELHQGQTLLFTVVGAFICTDGGVRDDKIIALPMLNDVPGVEEATEQMSAIQAYLERYKDGFKVLNYVGKEEAESLIGKCMLSKG